MLKYTVVYDPCLQHRRWVYHFDGAASLFTSITTHHPSAPTVVRSCTVFALMWGVGINVWLCNCWTALREWQVRVRFLRRQVALHEAQCVSMANPQTRDMGQLGDDGMWHPAWTHVVAQLDPWSPPVRGLWLLFGSPWLMVMGTTWLLVSWIV